MHWAVQAHKALKLCLLIWPLFAKVVHVCGVKDAMGVTQLGALDELKTPHAEIQVDGIANHACHGGSMRLKC